MQFEIGLLVKTSQNFAFIQVKHIHKLTNHELCNYDVSCPLSKKAAALHQFTMSDHYYRLLSIRDTLLNNHYTLYINSKTIKKMTSFYQKIFLYYRIGYLCQK